MLELHLPVKRVGTFYCRYEVVWVGISNFLVNKTNSSASQGTEDVMSAKNLY